MPWLESHPAVSDNKSLALRLQFTVKKLKNEGFYEVYHVVFDKWLTEGVIECVTEEEKNIVKLSDSLYADNFVTSVNTTEELNNFIIDAKAAMELAGFD